jgi:hypothetical protein
VSRDFARWSVPLPSGAEPPFEVYVNGEPRQEGLDYTVEGRWLRFATPLTPRPSLGLGRRLLLLIGIGVYGDLKGDEVDLRYRAGGRPQVANRLPIIPPQPPPG